MPSASGKPDSAADLVHVSDILLPGITRQREKEGFAYYLPDGRRLRDEAELQRIRRLAIPPAYTEVWICPLPHGHLQATGRDARGRKQYRYHAQWNAHRNSDKFDRLEAFGQALARIRQRVQRDLATGPIKQVSRSLILATLVRLLDITYVRIGNEAYARANRSYGLTTLRNRHADIHGKRVQLSFRGKHGIKRELSLEDPKLVRVIRRCKQLPGQELFQYEEEGSPHGISSGDVNDYISEAAGERFTAKDFRTWHGTVQALELMRLACSQPAPAGTAHAFRLQPVLAAVASRLGNTVAVCRKSYIHPAVLALGQDLASDEGAMQALAKEQSSSAPIQLQAAERRLLDFLARSRRAHRTSSKKLKDAAAPSSASSRTQAAKKQVRKKENLQSPAATKEESTKRAMPSPLARTAS